MEITVDRLDRSRSGCIGIQSMGKRDLQTR